MQLEEAQEYLTVEKGAEITGVEIMEGASPVMKFDQKTGVATFPFRYLRVQGLGWRFEGGGLASHEASRLTLSSFLRSAEATRHSLSEMRGRASRKNSAVYVRHICTSHTYEEGVGFHRSSSRKIPAVQCVFHLEIRPTQTPQIALRPDVDLNNFQPHR